MPDKTTFALFFGNRGFFPGSLIASAREELTSVLKRLGYSTLMMDAGSTRFGAVETPAESRHVVFTAGYRLTRKGPDRGKWFFELAATADAPLATVDMVVRGVMHRSKDLTESERLSGDQLRALLAQPAWRTTP